jgi:hypothetical protein
MDCPPAFAAGDYRREFARLLGGIGLELDQEVPQDSLHEVFDELRQLVPS